MRDRNDRSSTREMIPRNALQKHVMHILKLIFLTLANLLKQVLSIPQMVLIANQRRQRQAAQQEFEIERLDRIRNPAKYAGR